MRIPVEYARYPHPSSLRRTLVYASFLGISDALYLGIFHQPPAKVEEVRRQESGVRIQEKEIKGLRKNNFTIS
jgi:hypothetical protein